jgi:hypothetical protein
MLSASTRPRFQKLHDISEEIAKLFVYSRDLPRGSLVQHSTIVEITGINRLKDGRPNPLYQALINKWKLKMLNETGIIPQASKGVGYHFPTVTEQQTEVADGLEQSARRKIKLSQDVIARIPDQDQSDIQKRFGRERIRQTNELIDDIRTHRAERKSYLANPDTLPRYNGNGND